MFNLIFRSRNQQEVHHTCRGSVAIHNAIITMADASSFTISNGGNQTFHVKASSEKDRQMWLNALALAKSSKNSESGKRNIGFKLDLILFLF